MPKNCIPQRMLAGTDLDAVTERQLDVCLFLVSTPNTLVAFSPGSQHGYVGHYKLNGRLVKSMIEKGLLSRVDDTFYFRLSDTGRQVAENAKAPALDA